MSYGLGVIVLGLICSYFQPCRGSIKFRDGFHKPRIYEKAPPGTYVTTVFTYSPDGPLQEVTYTLIEIRDSAYFQLDSSTGNLSTKKTIDKKAGDSYEIIIVAMHQGKTRLLQMDIYVTVFNTFTPKFENPLYRAELHTEVTGGTLVFQVKANDKDPVKYNKEIYYSMERNEASSYFVLNENTGDLFVRRKLNDAPKKLLFRVFAEDGGSPKRTSETFVEILIKTISEPIDITVGNTTETSVVICWKRPNYGQVNGYLIRYHEVKRLDASPSQVNFTTNASSICKVLENVSPWTDYQFRLYAWNMNETGLGSDIVRFGTRPNFCERRIAVCKNGECQSINHQPGYICHCKTGYYGFNCDKFDPCSLNPCENYGTCRNLSNTVYECQCASGFSGNSCNIFNPCAIRTSPCQNNGKCESKQSHTYHCLCSSGYYGSKCQYYNPCVSSPCVKGVCRNLSDTDFQCKCNPGYTGKLCETDFNECSLNPCENGGTCTDGVNSYRCDCVSGYRGRKCQHIIRCPSEVLFNKKGKFEWKDTPHGKTAYLDCPYGTISSYNRTGYKAKRKCKLIENNTVLWEIMETEKCRDEDYKLAKDITGQLQELTGDPNNLTEEKLANTAEKIHEVVKFAVKDKEIAENMLIVISNVMAVNQSVLDSGDQDGNNTGKLVQAINTYLSEVDLNEFGGSIALNTENIAIKASKIDEKTEINRDMLTFSPYYKNPQQRNFRFRRSGKGDGNEDMAASITVSSEAITLAQKQIKDPIRLKFSAFRNDKFFHPKRNCPKNSCSTTEALFDRNVIDASINNMSIYNLTEPIEYWISTPNNLPVLCVYWNKQDREWSTEGLWSNQTDNYTLCFSNHLTAFSILFDPDPDMNIPEVHQKALSLISYIGCGLSVFGLLLTILTYSLFRCLNRDHSGKILLNLCFSMLLMNLSFLANTIPYFRKELCTISAIFIHYFVLTTLSWMCVEAINIYQLLIHVFASAETRFMLKRFIFAWGIPFVIVAVTAGINLKHYDNPNEYCMLSPANPYVYYISLLGPSCLILFVNLIVFIMVSRVLFTPRMNSKPGATKKKGTVTIAQIRGAFTVMVLLGITWVFGALAVKQLKLIFQYIFCIANSLQGLLIFIVRCLLYPEARCAWKQLITTGTLKRHRGVLPPGGSWYANSNSSQKQNGCSTSSRVNSSENTGAIVFNTNYWNSEKESRSLPLKFPCLGTATNVKNNSQQKEQKRKSSSTGLYGNSYARNSRDLSPPLNDPTIVYIDEEEQEKALDSSHPSDVYKSLLERPDYFSQELEKRNTLQRTVTTFLTGREGQRDTPTSSLLAESPHTEQSSVAESPAPTEQMSQSRNEKKKLSFKSKEPSEDKRNEAKTHPRMDSTEERTEL